LKDHAIIDSGCSGSMTGDKDKLSDFKEYKGGYVAFGNDPKGGRITGKGTIKTIMIEDQLLVDVNILEGDWSLGSARNKQLWLSHLLKQNM
ncbi:hypothetical protein Tco_0485669, partial [Tanacetum coccineum]